MFFNSLTDRITVRRLYVFGLFWIVLFILYLPAAKAGLVSDTTGWVQSLQRDSFADYINRTHFGVRSMYQLTQLNTWLLYGLFGHHPLPWHLLQVTMHAVNCLLLYTFCARLFEDAGIQYSRAVSLAGSMLFCISPYISEVVVWEASFHYLQALLFIFGILVIVQRFQHRPAPRLAAWAGLLFFLSTFSLELFYLVPWFVLSLAIFYRTSIHRDAAIFRKTLLYFFLPQLLLFGVHMISFRAVYGGGMAHLGMQMLHNPIGYFLVRPPWYFFHLFAWGRFFPNHYRQAVYNIFRTPGGAILFYSLMLAVCLLILFRLRRMNTHGRLVSLFLLWLLLALAIVVPLWFPELLLVVCDRYVYLMLAFQWMLVVLLLYRVRKVWLRNGLLLLLGCINLYFTLKLSRYWWQSEKVIAGIERSSVPKPGKVKLLLNSPACLKGIPMIGTSPEGEYRLMHNLFFSPPIADTMLEVAAYNMDSPRDGVHVEVVNDSTVKVTLNQWGTWWWLGGFGATSYSNQWFRLDMVDAGHWYNLILKKDTAQYQLLYQTGNELKEVNWRVKGEQN